MAEKNTSDFEQMNTEVAAVDAKIVDKQKTTESRDGRRKAKKRKPRIRLIPIWLRLIIVTALFAFSLIAGAMVGYGVIGEGEVLDVFKTETWTHPYDIVFGGSDP